MNIWIKMYADNHNIPLSEARVTVQLDRSNPQESCFQYTIDLDGELSDDQRNKLFRVLKACPVRKTLSKSITFKMFEE